jgi:hypothetical protein
MEFDAQYGPKKLIETLESRGDPLQITKKRSVCRHGDWVVKKSLFDKGIGPLKHTFKRSRYRVGWNASVVLTNRGVPVAKPLGFIEYRVGGVIWTNCLVTEYLKDCVNIADYLRTHELDDEGKMNFLRELTSAINQFIDSGAYNQDLKVQNLLTSDGKNFHFIDLDEVVLDKPYPADVRMKNHTQLLYGLNSYLTDTEKGIVINSLGVDGLALEQWREQVDEGVAAWIKRKEKLNEKLGTTVD